MPKTNNHEKNEILNKSQVIAIVITTPMQTISELEKSVRVASTTRQLFSFLKLTKTQLTARRLSPNNNTKFALNRSKSRGLLTVILYRLNKVTNIKSGSQNSHFPFLETIFFFIKIQKGMYCSTEEKAIPFLVAGSH